MTSHHDGQHPAADAARAALGTAFAELHLDPDTRARHLHAVRRRAAGLPAPAQPTRRPGGYWQRARLRLAAVAAAATLLFGGGAGVALASTDALPGDRLYPVKLAVEEAALRLPAEAETAVSRLLDTAERRLEEAERLQSLGRSERVAETLERQEQRVAQAARLAAGDPDLEAAVQAAGARAYERLGELLAGGLPGEASDRAREAIEAARDRLGERAGPQTAPSRRAAPTRPTRPAQQPADERISPATERRPDGRGAPEEPGRPADPGPRALPSRPQQDQRDTDARPGGGTPPPSPGSRAPRGPRG